MDEARLQARLAELETRVAFQEQALAELSDALAQARIETGRTAQLLQRALDELQRTRDPHMADPADEPPPPHY